MCGVVSEWIGGCSFLQALLQNNTCSENVCFMVWLIRFQSHHFTPSYTHMLIYTQSHSLHAQTHTYSMHTHTLTRFPRWNYHSRFWRALYKCPGPFWTDSWQMLPQPRCWSCRLGEWPHLPSKDFVHVISFIPPWFPSHFIPPNQSLSSIPTVPSFTSFVSTNVLHGFVSVFIWLTYPQLWSWMLACTSCVWHPVYSRTWHLADGWLSLWGETVSCRQMFLQVLYYQGSIIIVPHETSAVFNSHSLLSMRLIFFLIRRFKRWCPLAIVPSVVLSTLSPPSVASPSVADPSLSCTTWVSWLELTWTLEFPYVVFPRRRSISFSSSAWWQK